MPSLVPVLDKIEDAPEAARPFYTQRDGKFHVDLTAAPNGFVPAADLAAANGKVVEFRENNIKLTNEVTELRPLKDRFKDIDPDAARVALAAQKELKDKGVNGVADLNVIVQAALKPVQDQLTTITANAAAERDRNAELTLSNVLGDKFVKAGGVPEAKDFIIGRAKGVFVAENGVVRAAPTQFSTDKPGEPLGVDEWLTRMTKESAFAFKPSGGGGANPVPANGGRTIDPNIPVLKDPTPQQLGQHSKAISQGKMRVEYSS